MNVVVGFFGNLYRKIFYFVNYEFVYKGYFVFFEEVFMCVLRIEDSLVRILKLLNFDEEGIIF